MGGVPLDSHDGQRTFLSTYTAPSQFDVRICPSCPRESFHNPGVTSTSQTDLHGDSERLQRF